MEIISTKKLTKKKSCSEKLSKYAAAFDYIDKILIVLSATSGGACIISSVSVVAAPTRIAGASFTLIFSLATGYRNNKEIIRNNKEIIEYKKKQKKKKNMIKFLCRLKLN